MIFLPVNEVGRNSSLTTFRESKVKIQQTCCDTVVKIMPEGIVELALSISSLLLPTLDYFHFYQKCNSFSSSNLLEDPSPIQAETRDPSVSIAYEVGRHSL